MLIDSVSALLGGLTALWFTFFVFSLACDSQSSAAF